MVPIEVGCLSNCQGFAQVAPNLPQEQAGTVVCDKGQLGANPEHLGGPNIPPNNQFTRHPEHHPTVGTTRGLGTAKGQLEAGGFM